MTLNLAAEERRAASAPPWLPAVAVGTTMVLWASAFVGIRHLGHDFSPGALSLGRLLVGAILLGAVGLSKGLSRPTAAQWVRIVVIGVLWFGVYNVSLNAGERRVDAGTASMLLQVSPIVIAALAAVFLGERFTVHLAIGLGLAFAGVAVIAFADGDRGHVDVLGVLLCLVPAAAYSTSAILQKPLMRELSAVQVTCLACSVGMITCLPWAGTLVRETLDAPVSSLLWLAYLGAFPTAIAFATYAYALRHMNASSLGVTTYLVPPLTIVMGLLFLGESPPTIAFAGGSLALLGVWLSRRRPAAHAGDSAKRQPAC